VHVPGREPYVRTRGVANMATGEPLTPEHLFRIASMSKPYLSVLLVKLAVEGRLSLDEPITERLPAELTALVPHAQDIALHDMLTHQSGIIDYRDLVFTSEVLFGDHAKVRDEYTDLVDGLSRNPTPCAPPRLPVEQVTPEIAGCLYSNSNYVLAGYIADQVLYGVEPAPGVRAEHHSRAFHDDLFAPLDLTSTMYEKHFLDGQSTAELLARGYFRPPASPTSDAPGELTDGTDWDDGNGYANGGLIATMSDVAAFRRTVFDPTQPFPIARLEDKARFLELLEQQNPLGVAPAGARRGDYWSIGGDIGGYTSLAEYAPATDTSIVLYSNDRDYEPEKYALADAVEALIASAAADDR
jgi:D-alanyl-D-alanine carboxypeptidase